jgi:hypothetical protein
MSWSAPRRPISTPITTSTGSRRSGRSPASSPHRSACRCAGTGQVTSVGGFYGQWEWDVTDLHHVSAEFLCWILENEVLDGWTEISCHPGFVTGDYRSTYLDERAVELQTLTDPRIREQIDQLGIRVANYRDFNRSAT